MALDWQWAQDSPWLSLPSSSGAAGTRLIALTSQCILTVRTIG